VRRVITNEGSTLRYFIKLQKLQTWMLDAPLCISAIVYSLRTLVSSPVSNFQPSDLRTVHKSAVAQPGDDQNRIAAKPSLLHG
jgi:hypothetical protein